ncbi:MAG: hypothetical protein KAT58_00735 [candidate division Zixibacteria bacterium]|nr:hypothetical protein [candidate division Zixibacteria bacterium]
MATGNGNRKSPSNAVKIILVIVAVVFLISWISKATTGMADSTWLNIRDGFLITFAAFLTLSIFSFLYNDNPFYKFAEHLYVGVSAAYWMCLGFWSIIVGNFVPHASKTLSTFFKVPFQEYSWFYYVAFAFGVILLMRLLPKAGWIARWPLAVIIGTTAGFNLSRYLHSDFMSQVGNTFQPLFVDWQGAGHFFSNLSLAADGQLVMSAGNWIVVVGVLCGLVYFFFSKEHKGMFGAASRLGIWILMITFGASFGYTVMGRISLLVGRITFLFDDWLSIL